MPDPKTIGGGPWRFAEGREPVADDEAVRSVFAGASAPRASLIQF
jgi:hypothetical protein